MKITGFIFVFAGILAIAFPHFSGLAAEVFYGVLIAILGAFYMASTLRFRTSGKGLHIGISLIFLLTGGLLLLRPSIGLSVLTVFIGTSFLMNGMLQGIHAASAKAGKAPLLFGGFVSAVTGALILVEFPSSADWVLGLLVGINLIIIGLTLPRIKIVKFPGKPED